LRNYEDLERLSFERASFENSHWVVRPILAGNTGSVRPLPVYSPSKPDKRIGYVSKATEPQVDQAIKAAQPWSATSAEERCRILNKAADLYEANTGELL